MNKQEKYNTLWTPFNIGNVEIKNRFVMGPMGMSFLNDEKAGFTEDAIAYYAERAKGGFGAIITGVQLVDRYVDPPMSPSLLNEPEHYIEQGKKLNEACNAHGCKVFLEVGFGVGRNYPTFKAPSAVPAFQYPTMMSTPLSKKEICIKRDEVIRAAVIGQKAGFSGIDIHTLHWGYLLDEFVLSLINKRTDEYGGSLENRLRLLRETVEGIQENCGKNYPITIGLGVKSYIKGLNEASFTGEDEAGRTVEEAIEIAKMLENMGIAAIMCDVGIYDSFYYACPPSYMPKGHAVDLYEKVKGAVNIPIMARSKLGDAGICADTINTGKADAIVLARPSLADSEFPNKVKEDKIKSIRPCIGCNMGCIATIENGQHGACAVNPKACYERITEPKAAENPKSIAVVGGGIAGMQACLTAVERGYKVELFEREDHLGGELLAAGAHEFKSDILDLNRWYISELEEKNVPIHLSTQMDSKMCIDGKYDTVIMATGASSIMPKSISGIEKGISAVELLEGNKEVGESVVVVGGGMVGCETAVDLAKKGKKVMLVEALPEILSAEFIPVQPKMMLKDMIKEYGVEVYQGCKLAEINDEGAVIEVANEQFTLGEVGEVASAIVKGNQIRLKADKVIISIGMSPNEKFTDELKEAGVQVIEVGNAGKPGFILTAVKSAFDAVYNLD